MVLDGMWAIDTPQVPRVAREERHRVVTVGGEPVTFRFPRPPEMVAVRHVMGWVEVSESVPPVSVAADAVWDSDVCLVTLSNMSGRPLQLRPCVRWYGEEVS